SDVAASIAHPRHGLHARRVVEARVLRYVPGVNNTLAAKQSVSHAPGWQRPRFAAAKSFDQLGRGTAEGDGVQPLLIPPSIQTAIARFAKSERLIEQRVEYRREVAGEGIDDLQYLGGGSLLFERLARLVDQPRVLDRDHCLIGEGAHQFDLPF